MGGCPALQRDTRPLPDARAGPPLVALRIRAARADGMHVQHQISAICYSFSCQQMLTPLGEFPAFFARATPGLSKQQLAQLVYDTVDSNGMRDHIHIRLMVGVLQSHAAPNYAVLCVASRPTCLPACPQLRKGYSGGSYRLTVPHPPTHSPHVPGHARLEADALSEPSHHLGPAHSRRHSGAQRGGGGPQGRGWGRLNGLNCGGREGRMR